ncbi:unnamed protein product [Symbiodinium sp. KB8]|nr:unnamed protein product [Symbiodinium sp. KB8]
MLVCKTGAPRFRAFYCPCSVSPWQPAALHSARAVLHLAYEAENVLMHYDVDVAVMVVDPPGLDVSHRVLNLKARDPHNRFLPLLRPFVLLHLLELMRRDLPQSTHPVPRLHVATYNAGGLPTEQGQQLTPAAQRKAVWRALHTSVSSSLLEGSKGEWPIINGAIGRDMAGEAKKQWFQAKVLEMEKASAAGDIRTLFRLTGCTLIRHPCFNFLLQRHSWWLSEKILHLPDVPEEWAECWLALLPKGVHTLVLCRIVFVHSSQKRRRYDIQQAFDRLGWTLVQEALIDAQVPVELRGQLLDFYRHLGYHLRFGDEHAVAVVRASRGVKQGCKVAPLLWSLTTGLLMRRLARRTSKAWLLQVLTAFADDLHLGQEVRSLEMLTSAVLRIGHLIEVLEEARMIINTDKSVILISLPFSFDTKWRRRRGYKLPVVSQHKYLGRKRILRMSPLLPFIKGSVFLLSNMLYCKLLTNNLIACNI